MHLAKFRFTHPPTPLEDAPRLAAAVGLQHLLMARADGAQGLFGDHSELEGSLA